MYVDLEAKEVTFNEGTVLTLAQLWSLVDLMDDEPDTEPQDWLPGWVLPDRIWTVQSHTTNKTYATVYLEDGTWACSCPDWIYRKHQDGQNCKHIIRLYWLR